MFRTYLLLCATLTGSAFADTPLQEGDDTFIGVVWDADGQDQVLLHVPDGYPVDAVVFWLDVRVVSSPLNAFGYSTGPYTAPVGVTSLPSLGIASALSTNRLSRADIRVTVQHVESGREIAYLAPEPAWFIASTAGSQRYGKDAALAQTVAWEDRTVPADDTTTGPPPLVRGVGTVATESNEAEVDDADPTGGEVI